jgi:hypothetical protein
LKQLLYETERDAAHYENQQLAIKILNWWDIEEESFIANRVNSGKAVKCQSWAKRQYIDEGATTIRKE